MEFRHEQLKELREKRRYSAKQFCEVLQISRHTLWQWETGKRVPKEANARYIAKVLSIPLSTITDLPNDDLESSGELAEALSKSFLLAEQGFEGESKNIEKIITEIRSLNDSLEKCSITIKALFSTMQSICYIKDSKQKYIIASPNFATNLSLHESYNVKGKDDDDFFSKPESAKNREEDFSVFKTGQPVVNREGYIPGSRKKKWGLISKHPIFDSNGNVIAVVGKMLDITKRKQLEQIREILELNINAMNQMVTVYNLSRKEFLYLNKAVETVSGYSLGALYEGGADFWHNTCVHPDDRDELKHYRQENKWPEKSEYRIIRPNGEVRWLEVIRHPEIIYSHTRCHLTSSRDITEHKKMAEKLRHLEATINCAPS